MTDTSAVWDVLAEKVAETQLAVRRIIFDLGVENGELRKENAAMHDALRLISNMGGPDYGRDVPPHELKDVADRALHGDARMTRREKEAFSARTEAHAALDRFFDILASTPVHDYRSLFHPNVQAVHAGREGFRRACSLAENAIGRAVWMEDDGLPKPSHRATYAEDCEDCAGRLISPQIPAPRT